MVFNRQKRGKNKCLILGLVILSLCVMSVVPGIAKNVTLRALYHKGHSPLPELYTIIPKYEEMNPGVKIVIDEVPYDQKREKMLLDFVSGTQEYQLLELLTDWIPELVKGGFVEPLQDYIRDDPPEDWPNAWPERLMELQTVGENIYGLPLHDGPIMFVYRKDLFEDPVNKTNFMSQYGYELKPPETWDQFLDMTRFFNKPSEQFWGTVLNAKQGGQQLAYDVILLLNSFGGKMFDDNWKPVFNSQEGIDGVQFYVDLYRKYKVTPPASTTYDVRETTDFYLQGKAAMAWNWTHVAMWGDLPEKSKIVGKAGSGLIPVLKAGMPPVTFGVYWVWSIPKQGQNKDEAYKFIKWSLNRENDKLGAFKGTVACRWSTYTDPEVLAKMPAYATITELLKGKLVSPPRIPEYAEIDDLLSLAASQALVGEKTVKEALDEAARKVEKIVREAGYYK